FQKLVSTLLPVYVKGAKEDHEREVVMAILEVLAKVVKECKGDVLHEPAQLTNLCRLVRELLEQKVTCQDDEDDEDDDDDEQAEYDCMLIEYAGELIPVLAEVTGGDVFAPYFAGLLPLLLSKM
ncbi:importin-4-like, partial [Pseudonaja textilis]|uniref:importin-4-like n=1 Tax=Pseudonaja textilis TaxID=8673 RepID=UPI000EA962D3